MANNNKSTALYPHPFSKAYWKQAAGEFRKTKVLLGLLTAILFVMSYTPLGYLRIGGIEITFNVIPVAIASIALGTTGGMTVGAVFGLTSFLQCVQGTSAFGATLLGINPIFTAILSLQVLLQVQSTNPFLRKSERKSPASSQVFFQLSSTPFSL